MTGPVLVVGRETILSSGAIDLVALARSGELLIVEFKTGPENGDFRRVPAQLVDYGSDFWGQSYEEFEQSAAVRYFGSAHCTEALLRGAKSLEAAARVSWPALTEGEFAAVRDRLSEQLNQWSFSYFVGAQRFTSSVGWMG